MGSSMVKYDKKVILKKINFKVSAFATLTLKKILKTYSNCILKSYNTSLSLLEVVHKV
jgi:hypothetical protein